MKSVPPRGSGWVTRLLNSNFRLPIAQIARRQSAITETHPLPRGGTDLINPTDE